LFALHGGNIFDVSIFFVARARDDIQQTIEKKSQTKTIVTTRPEGANFL